MTPSDGVPYLPGTIPLYNSSECGATQPTLIQKTFITYDFVNPHNIICPAEFPCNITFPSKHYFQPQPASYCSGPISIRFTSNLSALANVTMTDDIFSVTTTPPASQIGTSLTCKVFVAAYLAGYTFDYLYNRINMTVVKCDIMAPIALMNITCYQSEVCIVDLPLPHVYNYLECNPVAPKMYFNFSVGTQLVVPNITMVNDTFSTTFVPWKNNTGSFSSRITVQSFRGGVLYSKNDTTVVNIQIIDRCLTQPINWGSIPRMRDITYEVRSPPIEQVVPDIIFTPVYCGPLEYVFSDAKTGGPAPNFLYFNNLTMTATIFSTDTQSAGTYDLKVTVVLRTNGFG